MGLSDMGPVDVYLALASNEPDEVDHLDDEEGPLDTELFRLSERHRAAVDERIKAHRG